MVLFFSLGTHGTRTYRLFTMSEKLPGFFAACAADIFSLICFSLCSLSSSFSCGVNRNQQCLRCRLHLLIPRLWRRSLFTDHVQRPKILHLFCFKRPHFCRVDSNTYLLLAECEVRTASYGPILFPSFKNKEGRKTRIHNLPYGTSKQG